MAARIPHEGEILGDTRSHDEFGTTEVYWGTIGWAGDAWADVAELGDGTNGPGGVTLVRVTLFKGRDITERPKKGIAQGRPVRAVLGWPVTVIPELNALVQVTFPGGDLETPGNGALTFIARPASTEQFAVGRALLDVGPNISLTVKGAWTQMTHWGPGARAWVGVGPVAGGAVGVYACDDKAGAVQVTGGVVTALGSDGSAAKTQLTLGGTEAKLALLNQGYVGVDAAGTWVYNQSGTAFFQAKIMAFGTNPTLPALAGLSGLAGVPCVNVLFSVS